MRWLVTAGIGVGAAAAGWLLVSLSTGPPSSAPDGAAVPLSSSGAGYLQLSSRFADTRLIINGRDTSLIGTTARRIQVLPGSVRLRVERAGCQPVEVTVAVAAGELQAPRVLNPGCR